MEDTLFLFAALAFLGAMLYYSSRKRKKAAEELQTKIVKGAYVMLTSGIYGKITSVLENKIELETAPGQKLLVASGAVRSIEQEPKTQKPTAAAKPAAKRARSASAKSTPKTTPKKK